VILMSRILCTLLYEIISTFHLDKYAFWSCIFSMHVLARKFRYESMQCCYVVV
jgi:hypothetical protein